MDIVIDSSALIAVIFVEPERKRIIEFTIVNFGPQVKESGSKI